jgi:hypothetical protein
VLFGTRRRIARRKAQAEAGLTALMVDVFFLDLGVVEAVGKISLQVLDGDRKRPANLARPAKRGVPVRLTQGGIGCSNPCASNPTARCIGWPEEFLGLD